MNLIKPFLPGVRVLIGISVFGIIQLGVLYYILNKGNENLGSYEIISFFNLFLIIFPLLEAFIYWRLRFNIQKKLWVHLHIWLLFTLLVILPIFMFVSSLYITLKYPPIDYPDLYKLIDKINDWSFWFLFLLAHIFFIATIFQLPEWDKLNITFV